MGSRSKNSLVWVDCEMTGLDPETDSILQISCFVTDYQLELLESNGWGAIIHCSKKKLDAMGDWCKETHASTGLIEAALASTMTPEQAASGLLEYVKKYIPEERTALLAGNSVHADKAFLSKRPYNKVLDHLHYRIFDVSSIKEAVRRWASDDTLHKAPRKSGSHEARQDILESIQEAKFYKDKFFDA
ncbi:MAG: hypothetical protein M1833_004939 [Piccolia ochrophora]|nr:MAG: hypothetical protein M1833_004939 [Piccolia ochrophora]